MKRHVFRIAVACGVLTAIGSAAMAAPSIAERVSPTVYVVRDDLGAWGGGIHGITHQRGADYWAKKVLDLSAVPEEVWQSSSRARLSAFFTVRDYSWHDTKATNGLDESFEIVINGKPHLVADNSGVPVYRERGNSDRCFRWHDFEIPKGELVRGRNEIIFRRVMPSGKNPDDYLYLGIDNSVPGRNSWVRFGRGQPWRQDRITMPDGGTGEYMVRLYLFSRQQELAATWRPGGASDDPQKLFDYAGSHGGPLRVEWDPQRFDRLSPLTIVVETTDARPFELRWLDAESGEATVAEKARGPRYESVLRPPLATVPGGVQLPVGVAVRSIRLMATESFHPVVRPVDMCPAIQPPKGRAAVRGPRCTIEGETVRLANANLRCRFSRAGGNLRLVSLWNEIAAAEMDRRSDDCALWLVEVAGKRYAGSRDFVCRSITPLEGKPGFRAALACSPIGLEATFSAWIDDELRMSLNVTNRRAKPLSFKLAFPHLAGLALSEKPSADYYYFPWGGGIISDAPAVIRRGYGDYAALYPVMDLFSPSRGAGLTIRSTDEDGRHKVLALRKYIPGEAERNGDAAQTPTGEEFKWTNPLAPVPGLSVAYEYLRRTRGPGESFAAKDAALRAHAGDWHAALRAYADWCHRVWKFRPYPSRLTPVVCIMGPGWAQDFLFRDGKYRTDFLQPQTDCVELMSWWDWSMRGPGNLSMDEFQKRRNEPMWKGWQPYVVKDPVTGQMMFNNNPGDYDGYNQRWGGLPAFRDAVRSYQQTGTLVTLYTDPMRVDRATRCGQKYGKRWGVINEHGKYNEGYESWRMCLDVAEYRQWMADMVRRVLRETGADGLRLDEHGHGGYACFSKVHRHTFAEWGTSEWQRATAESAKVVRQAMDEVNPRSVLMTEHPGYDFLFPFLEGCITYDQSVQASELRPAECNTQRFYFPECKAYELALDHQRLHSIYRRSFWNGVGAFGFHYATPMYNVLRENEDVFASRDCEPLVPTLARWVYANRFRSGEKTFYTLLNATGHSYAGPVLSLDVGPGEHVFDLLRGREAELHRGRQASQVRTFLVRDDVTCMAKMPTRLTIKRAELTIEATVRDPRPTWQVRLCDVEGKPLLSVAAEAKTKLDLAPLGAKAKAARYIKLTDGLRLVDAAASP
jgi:hypothetical protein